MAKGPKKTVLEKKLANWQRQVKHQEDEIAKIQAKIDDPNNTDDAELEIELDEAVQVLAKKNAKIAKLTGSVPPDPDPV